MQRRKGSTANLESHQEKEVILSYYSPTFVLGINHEIAKLDYCINEIKIYHLEKTNLGQTRLYKVHLVASS